MKKQSIENKKLKITIKKSSPYIYYYFYKNESYSPQRKF